MDGCPRSVTVRNASAVFKRMQVCMYVCMYVCLFINYYTHCYRGVYMHTVDCLNVCLGIITISLTLQTINIISIFSIFKENVYDHH